MFPSREILWQYTFKHTSHGALWHTIYWLWEHQIVRSFWTSSTNQPECIKPHNDAPKMAPSSRVVKCQDSSKSHLFQNLKNTLISRWLLVTTDVDFAYIESEKCHFLRKYRYFMIIFYVKSVKYTEGMKCSNRITRISQVNHEKWTGFW